jgi:uncharacterized protein YdhG (YjbR/CyaY superfamily)
LDNSVVIKGNKNGIAVKMDASVSFDELKDMIFAGTIQDSKTISAVLAYDALLNRKKNN